jgi:hypothetical protein
MFLVGAAPWPPAPSPVCPFSPGHGMIGRLFPRLCDSQGSRRGQAGSAAAREYKGEPLVG